MESSFNDAAMISSLHLGPLCSRFFERVNTVFDNDHEDREKNLFRNLDCLLCAQRAKRLAILRLCP